MTEVELEIATLSQKGHGRTYYKEKALDIPGALPGESVLIEIPKRAARRKVAQLLKITKPSQKRVEPRCLHADLCGGCSFQSLAYEEQLRFKQQLIEKLFTKEASPIIPCDPPFYGRNKMDYTFSENRAGEKFLGLMIKGSKGHVFNLTECHLTSPWFVQTLTVARQWWNHSTLQAYYPPADRGHLRTLTLRETTLGQRMAILTVSGNSEYALNAENIETFKEALLSIDPELSLFLRIHQICKGKPTQFYEMHLSGPTTIRETLMIRGRAYTFEISPTSFFQPNTRQAEKLYSRALEMAALQKSDCLFDLYCGTGTIAHLMAPHVKEVIGIELNPYAVYDAQKNAQVNQLSNITFYAADVGEKLRELKEGGVRADIIIVDPPRTGLSAEALSHLADSSAKTILYISCNPLTQKENIDALAPHYELKELQPLDQFPHSPHVENIALLIKKT